MNKDHDEQKNDQGDNTRKVNFVPNILSFNIFD